MFFMGYGDFLHWHGPRFRRRELTPNADMRRVRKGLSVAPFAKCRAMVGTRLVHHHDPHVVELPWLTWNMLKFMLKQVFMSTMSLGIPWVFSPC